MCRIAFHALIVAVCLSITCQVSHADQLQCPQFFYQKTPPVVTDSKEQQGTVALCHDGYANLYSSIVMDPLFSADVLTQESVDIGRGIGRHGVFHAEGMLPPRERLYPNDYRNPRGGFWDRGHMVPNGDMPTPLLQEETFSMSNMVPQDADNNERLHEGIETTVRRMAHDEGQVFVVTGPIFLGAKLSRLNDKAYIPTMIFKAIYIPQKGGAVYVENNIEGMQYSVISLAQLNKLAHIDAFPAVSDDIKNKAIALPTPHPSMKGPSREAKARHFFEGTPQQVTLQRLMARQEGLLSLEQARDQELLPAPRESGDYRKRYIEHPGEGYSHERSREYHHHHRHHRRAYREHEEDKELRQAIM